ncbi:ras-related protein Rab-5B-like [Haliotis cracherodii]|uniref:ras-related protein Rab-5B-like n=1 Tax=Haliotis cracherodii TaxID=6455 RepID=UPI0039E93770
MARASTDAQQLKVASEKKGRSKVKICLLGPSESGKSELVKYLIKGNSYMHLGVRGACFVYGLRLEYNPPVMLDVTECRGTKTSQLQQATKHKPDVYFLLYDVNSKTSLEKMEYLWINDLYYKNIVTIIIGNKSDLPSDTQDAKFLGISDKAWNIWSFHR